MARPDLSAARTAQIIAAFERCVARRGLEINAGNEKAVREDLRQKGGMAVMANLSLPRIRAALEQAELRERAAQAVAEIASSEARALKAENERKEIELKKARELEQAHTELQQTHEHLKATQDQLIHAEKMASLGQLTAGIAHEIKNPLNFVNNFAQLSVELADELTDELDAGTDKPVAEIRDDLGEILADLKQNAVKINQHGKRADGIVKSMLEHARSTLGERCATDLNALLDEYVNLAYHGMRAGQQGFRCDIERNYDETVSKLELVPQEVGRVFLNLLNNAFEAVYEHVVKDNGAYLPTVRVSTRQVDGEVKIRVCDNGPGIPAEIKDKIFEPFFTTKPTGRGTGLGLSLSYDIVTQGYGGMLTVESEEGKGATFIFTLPVNQTETASST